jgi:hypothetical protein
MFTAGPSGNDYDECSQTADPEANRDEMNRQVVGHQTEPELPAQVGLESKRCHRHGEVPPPPQPGHIRSSQDQSRSSGATPDHR